MARLAGIDIPPQKRVVISLIYIHGIGNTTAEKIVKKSSRWYGKYKDARTGFEVGNAQGVLDGDLDGFIRAFLLQSAGNGS